MKNNRMSTKKLTLLALSVAVAMILSYVEILLPGFSHIAPGLKIGLPNIAIVSILYIFGTKDAAIVSFIRVFLTSLLFTSFFMGVYGLAGAVLSLAVMSLLKWSKKFSMVFVSIAGAISHNVAQIAIFMLVSKTEEIISYLPFLMIGGVFSGLAVGIIARVSYKYVERIYKKV